MKVVIEKKKFKKFKKLTWAEMYNKNIAILIDKVEPYALIPVRLDDDEVTIFNTSTRRTFTKNANKWPGLEINGDFVRVQLKLEVLDQ